MVIQVQGQQRTDIEFEHLVLRHSIGHHLGVEAVNSLYNDNGIILQPQLLPVPLPFPGHKIKGWEHNLLPGKQRGNIRPEQGRVQGVDMLQIQLAIRAGGKFIPVDVIVIQAHEDGLFAMNPQLRGKAVGGSGFAGGAGSCQHHYSGFPLAHHICNLRNPLFVERLVDPNQLPDAAGAGLAVQIRHGAAFHQRAPAFPL